MLDMISDIIWKLLFYQIRNFQLANLAKWEQLIVLALI